MTMKSRALPEDFPHPFRSSGTAIFERALGVGRTTIFRYVRDGIIKPPVSIGSKKVWSEKYMADVALNGTGRIAVDPLS